jgi:hypothetical protein
MYLLDYRFSVASAIGFIALGGVAVEIGVVMMLYLDRALERRREAKRALGLKLTPDDIREAVIEGALLRLRPVTMTKVAIIAALLPILLGTGAGSEAMQRIAAPMWGRMVRVALPPGNPAACRRKTARRSGPGVGKSAHFAARPPIWFPVHERHRLLRRVKLGQEALRGRVLRARNSRQLGGIRAASVHRPRNRHAVSARRLRLVQRGVRSLRISAWLVP